VEGPQKQGPPERRQVRSAGVLLTAGLQITAGTLLMGGLGYWLDLRWSTTPWLMTAGIFFGAAAGIVSFIRTVLRMNDRDGASPP